MMITDRPAATRSIQAASGVSLESFANISYLVEYHLANVPSVLQIRGNSKTDKCIACLLPFKLLYGRNILFTKPIHVKFVLNLKTQNIFQVVDGSGHTFASHENFEQV